MTLRTTAHRSFTEHLSCLCRPARCTHYTVTVNGVTINYILAGLEIRREYHSRKDSPEQCYENPSYDEVDSR